MAEMALCRPAEKRMMLGGFAPFVDSKGDLA